MGIHVLRSKISNLLLGDVNTSAVKYSEFGDIDLLVLGQLCTQVLKGSVCVLKYLAVLPQCITMSAVAAPRCERVRMSGAPPQPAPVLSV